MDAKNGRIITSIYARIFIVIIATAIVITISGLAVGAVFLTNSITRAIENHMLVAVDIADQYVTKEIELLKMKAAEAAKDIYALYEAGEREGALGRILAQYPEYVGLAVFDQTTLLDFYSETLVSPCLIHEPFMRTALAGGQAISTTMYCLDGTLVMYVTAPISDGLVLAAILPGLHFSGLVSQFTFWQSGHLFIDDEEGTVISNIRQHWVQQRTNFIEMAKTDSTYEGVASMVRRVITGERGTAHFSVDGVPRICAFRPISSPTENWFLGVIAPTPESELKDIPNSIFLMGMIMLILSAVAAIPAAALLKRPYEEVDRLRRSAEVASISKSTFLANMSHEIRTPMNSIIGFSELALNVETTPKIRDYFSKIRTNADWLLQIINDILDISKIEAGKMDLEKIPFSMHELFVSCRTLIMPKAVEKGIILYFYAEPSMGKVPISDPTRLRQVFVNLLSNAVKFTNTGVVKLSSSIKEMSEKTITIRFEIKDSGIGMTPEQIRVIFSPFTQAESGTTRKYGGTGLGLAITKNIVEMLGGELSVESSPGLGSKFSFDLTFDTIDASSGEMLDKKMVVNELEKPTFEGEVLLCEDNFMNQQVICEHLSRVGLQIVVAENGKIGVDMVKSRMQRGEKQFDLILMDMHMPVMDGLEATAKILELNTEIPIVAMTANIMSNDKEIYRMSGMKDCVGKPFTSQELWRCLIKYFKPLSWQPVNETQQNALAESEFLHELMIDFAKDNQTKFSEIAGYIRAGDIKTAHRLAHTLKSSAAYLGKTLLQKAAEDVEQHLKDGKNLVTPQQMVVLETELGAVLAELAPLLDMRKNDERN